MAAFIYAKGVLPTVRPRSCSLHAAHHCWSTRADTPAVLARLHTQTSPLSQVEKELTQTPFLRAPHTLCRSCLCIPHWALLLRLLSVSPVVPLHHKLDFISAPDNAGEQNVA